MDEVVLKNLSSLDDSRVSLIKFIIAQFMGLMILIFMIAYIDA